MFGRLGIDEIADKIAALGVPGLVLVVVMAQTGYSGAAALTKALATLGGPFGMLGGIAMLVLLSLIARALAAFGVEAVFKAVLEKLIAEGHSIEEIREKVDGWWFISSKLKAELNRYLDIAAAGTHGTAGVAD